MTIPVTLPTESIDTVMMLAAHYNVSYSTIVKRAIADYVAKETHLGEIESWWETVKNESSSTS